MLSAHGRIGRRLLLWHPQRNQSVKQDWIVCNNRHLLAGLSPTLNLCTQQPLTSVHAQVCRHLAEQTADLEAAAHPALDALTRRVMTTTLERVRRVKTRLVRLKTRVETVRLLCAAVLRIASSTVRAQPCAWTAEFSFNRSTGKHAVLVAAAHSRLSTFWQMLV